MLTRGSWQNWSGCKDVSGRVFDVNLIHYSIVQFCFEIGFSTVHRLGVRHDMLSAARKVCCCSI